MGNFQSLISGDSFPYRGLSIKIHGKCAEEISLGASFGLFGTNLAKIHLPICFFDSDRQKINFKLLRK